MENTFASRLKTLLKQKKISQSELARQLLSLEYPNDPEKIERNLQTKRTTINRWVKGIYKCPDLKNIESIALVLNVDEKYLLGKLKLPLPITFDEQTNKEINKNRARLFLFQYISEYLNFDVHKEVATLNGASLDTAFKEYPNGDFELYFYALEREIGAYITARLDALGIPKKAGESSGSIQK